MDLFFNLYVWLRKYDTEFYIVVKTYWGDVPFIIIL